MWFASSDCGPALQTETLEAAKQRAAEEAARKKIEKWVAGRAKLQAAERVR